MEPYWVGTEQGSSPLTRGKHRLSSSRPGMRGLIPAHAGKTRLWCASPPPHLAHPRSRGENGKAAAAYFHTAGSSPLTRGKRAGRYPRADRRGLIPAHAGKTADLVSNCVHHRAHPRSRGENTDDELAAGESGGSSPLTRGKRWPRGWPAWPAGLIPAHAGKTACRGSGRS